MRERSDKFARCAKGKEKREGKRGKCRVQQERVRLEKKERRKEEGWERVGSVFVSFQILFHLLSEF